MIDEGVGREHRPSSVGYWLAGIVLLTVVAGAALLFWRGNPSFRYPDLAEISIEEYFEAKKKGWIKEVWVEGDDLYAAVMGAYVRDNKAYRHVHVIVPPFYLTDEHGFQELRSGVDPLRFTYINRRSWGCNR